MTEPDEQRQGLFDLAKGLRGRWSIAMGLVLAWVAWSLLDLVLVDLAYNVETYQYRIDVIGWRESWPLLRWIPAWTGIVLAGSQIRSFDRSRSRSCLWLIGGLVALRLISLAPSLGTVAPVLGILWSSHVSWALSLSIPVYVIYPWLNAALASRHRTVGIGLVLSFGILYLAYAVFFVRTTILHGDETQYMMIAQSLVQDGDIDLSNTSEASVLEFHELPNVYPRRAPASPPGVTHPTHPIGLGLILAPAYWLGSSIDHPRLLCALLASITGVLVLFFVHRWLIGLDFTAAGVLITTIGAGFSPLLFLYSNQLYPGIFAVAGALAVLVVLTGPVRKGCAKVFLSSLVVIALPMLHPRLLPLAGFLGVGIVLRIRSTPHPLFVAKGVAAMAAIGLAGHVLYHNHYSGDIWGPFKPGNAWEANVIDFGDLPMALCGQWLDAKIGLLNNSPIYVATLVGVVAMVWRRDRLLLLAIGLYVTTACVNALSIDWRFGYCLPSRFMVTPLPALLLPMAVTVDRALRENIPLVFVLILGGCLGWDGIREVLSLTEAAYAGGHLIYRSIDQVYPIGTHFPLLIDEAASVPWLDVIGWGAGVALLFFTGLGSRRQRMVLVIVSIVVVPAVGRAHYVDRLDGQAAPARSLRRFSSWDEPNLTHSSHQKNGFSLRNGSVIEGAHYVVRPPATRPGIVGQGVLPFVFPSVYVAAIPATALQPSDDGPKGYYVLNKRYSVRALTNHETRYAVSITFGAQAAFVRFVQTRGKALVHHFVTYRGGVELEFGDAAVVLHAAALHETQRREFSRTVDLFSRQGTEMFYGFVVDGLQKGFYRVNVVVEDVDPIVWLTRKSDPIVTLIFEEVIDLADGRAKALAWHPMIGKPLSAAVDVAVERPSVEAYLSPFWATVPFTDQTGFDFEIDKDQTLCVAISYSGEHDLVVKSIDLYRRSFASSVDGSSFVLPDKPAGW